MLEHRDHYVQPCHFTDEKTNSKRHEMTCLRSHNKIVTLCHYFSSEECLVCWHFLGKRTIFKIKSFLPRAIATDLRLTDENEAVDEK